MESSVLLRSLQLEWTHLIKRIQLSPENFCMDVVCEQIECAHRGIVERSHPVRQSEIGESSGLRSTLLDDGRDSSMVRGAKNTIHPSIADKDFASC